MGDNIETKTARPSRRRRSSGSSAKLTWTAANSLILHPMVGKAVMFAMLAGALVYPILSAYRIDQATIYFGPLWRGMTQTDALYVLGAPDRKQDSSWAYGNVDTSTTLVFDDQGRASRITCSTRSISSAACPPVLNVGIGTPEDKIWTTLGRPSRERYQGEIKVITYEGLGVEFTLERFTVQGIALVPRERSDLRLPETLRIMLP